MEGIGVKLAASLVSLTVVVPTRNRPVELGQCLGSIAAVPTPGLREIIVVDDASSQPVEVDLPLAVPVRMVRNGAHRGAAASRNAAAWLVDADAIAFLDDDAVVFDDWFWVAQQRLLCDRAAITGRVLPIDHGAVSRARQGRYERRYEGLVAGAEVDFLAGGNSVVWTEAFRAAGGFPDVATGSDNLLVGALRERGGCRFEPGLRILHRNSKGLPSALREAWRAGACAGPDRVLGSKGLPTRPLRAALRAWRQPDAAAGLLNVVLQLAFEAGRLKALATSRKRGRLPALGA